MIVACNFAFDRQAARSEMNARMKKENRMDRLLNQVRPIIAARQVRQLVAEDMFKLRAGSLFANRSRQKNARFLKPDHHGRVQFAGGQKKGRARNPHLAMNRRETLHERSTGQNGFAFDSVKNKEL